jgi:hypothetical protein
MLTHLSAESTRIEFGRHRSVVAEVLITGVIAVNTVVTNQRVGHALTKVSTTLEQRQWSMLPYVRPLQTIL